MLTTKARRGLCAAAIAAAATILAACGDDSAPDNSTAANGSGGSDGDTVVQVGDDGLLVDGSGMTLYTANVEENGEILCVDECVDFWLPVTVPTETVTAPDGVDGLATVTRPDTGDLQLTYGGVPLYTFSLDSAAGDVQGDGFSDDFAGRNFVWSAVSTADSAGPPSSTPGDGGGYGGY